jgi:metal-dependent hydrolase (beta-lactamase superfamily II)
MIEMVRITILVDNTSNHPTLLAEHGLAFGIECGSRKILFDTGASHIKQVDAMICSRS